MSQGPGGGDGLSHHVSKLSSILAMFSSPSERAIESSVRPILGNFYLIFLKKIVEPEVAWPRNKLEGERVKCRYHSVDLILKKKLWSQSSSVRNKLEIKRG